MKTMLSVIFLFFLTLTLNAQLLTKWTYDGAVPDSVTQWGFFNSLHGVAVDKEGKIWLQDYYASTKDSVGVMIKGVLTWYKVRVLRIYKKDGTEASFSPMVTITYPGGTDTLGGTRTTDSTWSANTGRGLGLAHDGNILASYFGTIHKINYKTGAGILKIVVDKVNSITRATTDTNGTIFVANVAPGFGLRMYSATGTTLGNAVDTTKGYSRGFEVSADGNTIFWAGYSLNKLMRYTRPDDLTPFSFKDTILIGMTAESMCRDPKDKQYIWVCAGPADAFPSGGYTPHTWYKIHSTTLVKTDSVTAKFDATHDGKHRGIGFTANGDTCYITTWANTMVLTAPKVQRFVKKAVGIEKESPIANNYSLEQNYPNPFNPSTSIRFSVAKEGFTTLRVYDILGSEVATLVNENLKVGSYSYHFDASKLTSGTYIYKLNVNGFTVSKKMAFVK
jgi:hypothetical protein